MSGGAPAVVENHEMRHHPHDPLDIVIDVAPGREPTGLLRRKRGMDDRERLGRVIEKDDEVTGQMADALQRATPGAQPGQDGPGWEPRCGSLRRDVSCGRCS